MRRSIPPQGVRDAYIACAFVLLTVDWVLLRLWARRHHQLPHQLPRRHSRQSRTIAAASALVHDAIYAAHTLALFEPALAVLPPVFVVRPAGAAGPGCEEASRAISSSRSFSGSCATWLIVWPARTTWLSSASRSISASE